MQIFYTPDINGIEYTLNEDESKHAIRVLRLNTGDTIFLVDGKGTLYETVIADAHPKQCKVIVKNVQTEYEKRNYHLHIAISPLKNSDRFEWFLEKATEIGIDEITPLLCDHSEKKNLNIDRCNRIVESAMKQSFKAYHPIIHQLTKFEDFVSNKENSVKLIAICDGERDLIRNKYHRGEKVCILIGPEGDFSLEEFKKAQSSGYIPITLGNSRLRTETAGLAACHSIHFMNL
jgi:16S rRNA (uracil1498-N3)-methyltransferase